MAGVLPSFYDSLPRIVMPGSAMPVHPSQVYCVRRYVVRVLRPQSRWKFEERCFGSIFGVGESARDQERLEDKHMRQVGTQLPRI